MLGACQAAEITVDFTAAAGTGPLAGDVTLNQGIPEFLYGYSLRGENYLDPYGTCPDSLDACYDWEGSGTLTIGRIVVTPEPAVPLPVLGYFSAAFGALWLRRRMASCC